MTDANENESTPGEDATEPEGFVPEGEAGGDGA